MIIPLNKFNHLFKSDDDINCSYMYKAIDVLNKRLLIACNYVLTNIALFKQGKKLHSNIGI